MNLIERFVAYAAAFEKTVTTNDFSHIEPFFSADAVYETSGGEPMNSVNEGRDAVFAYLEESLDMLDRRFEERETRLVEGPTLTENTVWFAWAATYSQPGLPDLVINGEETAVYEGELIRRLEDRFTQQAVDDMTQYLEEHDAELVPARKG